MNGNAKLNTVEHDVIVPEPEMLPVHEEGEFDTALVQRLDQAVESYKKIVSISIKLTNAWDWSDLGGKPYLQCSGAEKIASPFKVSMGVPTKERLERTDKEGKPYYIWVFQATFSSSQLRRTIVAQGKCSSRDQFFGKDGETFKEMDDVREEDVLQAAYTNLFNNGVQRLLGIRNLTWEQLAQGGIKQEAVGKVAFRKGGQGGGRSEAASKPGIISSGQVKLVFARLAANKVDPKDLIAHLEVLNIAKNEKGERDFAHIPTGQLDEVLAWIGQAEQRRQQGKVQFDA